MTQSILYKLIMFSLLLTLLIGLGSHGILLFTGAEDSPLERWRLLGFVGLGLSLATLWWFYRCWQRRQTALNQAERLLYSLAPRPGPDLVTCEFWRRAPGSHLSRGRLDLPAAHISLELNGDHHQSLFSLSTPAELAQEMTTEVSKEWAKVEIRRLRTAAATISAAEAGEIFVDIPHRGDLSADAADSAWRWRTLTLAQPDFHPLRTVEIRYGMARPPSPVGGLLAEIEALPVGTIGGVQVLVRPAPPSKRQAWELRANLIRRQLNNRGSHSQTQTHNNESGSLRRATSQQYGPINPDQLQAELARISERLTAGPLYEVCLRVWACGPTAEREVERVSNALISQTRSGWNHLKVDKRGTDAAPVLGRHFPASGGFIMGSSELGQLLYLPNQVEAAPYARLHTAGAEPLAAAGQVVVARADTVLHGSSGQTGGKAFTPLPLVLTRRPVKRFYGVQNRSSGEETIIGHSFQDATTHTFICGATGSGKSVLGANLVLQDWLAGHGALVIDPHRSLIDDILQGVPLEREGDVILLDPGDLRQPFRFNLFDVGQGKETAVERLMAALRAGMGTSWDSSVGMQEVLFHALTLALHGAETASMLTLADLLDEQTRAAYLEKVQPTSPQAQQALAFWQKQFPSWNGQDQKRAIGAARRRVENFTRRGLVRRTLGQAGSTVNLAEALNSGKLVLCPMHDEMGEETKRIWSVLLLQELIALLLARDPRGDLPPITVAIDELAESIGALAEFVGVLLNETRKYGAAVILMNQSYVSLPPEVRQVVIGNCRSQIALSLGAEDAQVAARIMGASVTAEDIQQLRPYRAYVRLALGGGQAAPCLVRTLPPLRAMARPKTAPWPTPPAALGDAASAIPANPGPELALESLFSWAREIEPGDSEGAGQLLAVLQELPPAKYEALCALRAAHNAWWVEEAMRTPGILMGKVNRLRLLSRLRCGIPWWQSDADYLRAVAERQRVVAEAKAAAEAAKLAAAQPGGDEADEPEDRRPTIQ
ncbi:MAG: hypothetical protein IPM39_27250 [Chloroflexi bacterium]|nr:hypothetical protein [Chloroflexota bacterium]